jgi:hypothetical protein
MAPRAQISLSTWKAAGGADDKIVVRFFFFAFLLPEELRCTSLENEVVA